MKKENYIPRKAENTIAGCLREFPVVMLTGARQTGKTTLLRQRFEDRYAYMNLEEQGNRMFAKNDPVGFLEKYHPPLIIDEIQYAPEVLSPLKNVIDNSNQAPGQYIITGSQRFEMMKGARESLAGRVAVLRLPGLAKNEISAIKGASFLESPLKYRDLALGKNDFLSEITGPRFPKPFTMKNTRIWMESYIETYIQKDVTEIINIRDLGKFRNFLNALASRAGQLCNHSSLGEEVGIDIKTSISWMRLLEASDIIYILYPVSSGGKVRTVKTPKIFFLDTGLLSHLIGIHSTSHLEDNELAGHVFENYIISEVIKKYYQQGMRPELNFWRTHSGIEVDLIAQWGNAIYPIEIKWTSTPAEKHLKGLTMYMKKNRRAKKGFIVSTIQKKVHLDRNIDFVNGASVF